MNTIEIPFSELEFSYSRSRGPGGQNVNKTNSAATLRWNLLSSQAIDDRTRERLLSKLAHQLTSDGEILIRSETHRDQDQNRSECIRKLQTLLKKALFVPKKRVATKPTKGSVRRRLEGKQRRSDVKKGRQKVEND